MHHDCVVVPGFGAFMINDEGARYDFGNRRFLPPSRTIGFNPEVRHNDALLVGSISRREGISIETARGRLDTAVNSLRHQLQLSGEVAVRNLGILSRGLSPDAPVFTPSELSLPGRRFEGLTPLSVLPLEMESEEENVAAGAAADADSIRQIIFPAPLKFVASIVAIMIGLGILYSTTSLVNSPRMNFASLDTGISSRLEQTHSIDTPAVSLDLSREIMLNIALPAGDGSGLTASDTHRAAVDRKAEAPTLAPQALAAPGRYILVVGSFPSRRAAERHIGALGDSSLRIVEMDGNFRIYTASASNINDARMLADTLKASYPNVWVCRR